MSETDIYKNREPLPYGSTNPKRPHRRRHSTREHKAFDDHSRKRRSRNSGLRRMLHLYRKKDNEKVFWWTVLGTVVLVLGLLAIWQFGVREHRIRKQEMQDDYLHLQQAIPEDQSSATE